MKTNNKGINLIKKWESLHDGDLKTIGLQPKKCPAGIWTEGYGHAMRDIKGNFLKGSIMPQSTINNEIEAQLLLAKDLEIYEMIVSRKVKIELTSNQFSALVSHTYNTGGSSTLFNLVNAKQDVKLWWTTKYTTADGVKLKGLINRRLEEYNLFKS